MSSSKDIEPEIEEAERMLNSTQPLSEIKKHLDNIIAGEDNNKQLIFLLLLSGKVPDPTKKQMILLKGPAGGGKTTLMGITDFFRTKTIGRLSETALDYVEDLQTYEVLKLQELGHMDYDRPLKFISADDKGYTIEVTVPSKQKETGESIPPFKTFSKHIPAITLITSTTSIRIEPQFRRRNWIVSPDEGKEQTENVRKWKIARQKEEDRRDQDLIQETSYHRSKIILTTLVTMIKPCKVVIPFKNTLTRLLSPENLEVRGHYDKLSSLAYLYGVLLQKQLPKLDGSSVLTAERALEVLEISKEAFEAMGSMESRITELIQVLRILGLVKGSLIDREERVRIGKKINRTPRTVLTYLNFLEDEGYVSPMSRGREKIFVLLDSPEHIAKRFSSLTSKLKEKDAITLFMNIEARNYLNEICDEKDSTEEEKEELLSHFPI